MLLIIPLSCLITVLLVGQVSGTLECHSEHNENKVRNNILHTVYMIGGLDL